tara:strand:+ start:45 stop:1244 length:1200 start_codon:yes stop_codon:yes gene_type:complete
MNQTEKAAYTLTRQRIVDQIDAIETQGGSAGTLKRLKRFGNAFSWYPEFYPKILEDINGMTDKQLMSALRTEDGFMKLMAPVKGLPIHHVFASRTGGDLPIRTPTDVFLDVRKRVENKYGFGPGNNPFNLGAQGAIDERMHQGRYGATGTVFDEARGLGMAPTKDLPILHGAGTRDIGGKLGQDKALIQSQSDEIFKAMEPYLDAQFEKFEEVSKHPMTIKQRKIIQEGIDPGAFDVGRTTEQSKAVQKTAAETGLDVKFASAFDFSKGTVTLNRNQFVNRLIRPAVGLTAFGALSDIGSVQAAVTTPRTEDMAQTERDISGLSGVAGLAALAPALAPVAAPAAIAFGGASAAISIRRKRDEELEQTRQFMDPANTRYLGDAVLTRTKPRLPTSFTGRL